MCQIVYLFIATLAVVSSEPKDQLEDIATNILSGLHSHVGGQGGKGVNPSFYTSLTDSAVEANKARKVRIEEGLGGLGITWVSVTRGAQQVNVTTLYGFGAGAVVDVKDKKRRSEELEVNESKQITQPLYEKYVKNILESESENAVIVSLGSEGRLEYGIQTEAEKIGIKAVGGFILGAKTVVSKSI